MTNEIIRLKALLLAGDFPVSSSIPDLQNKLKELVSKELSGVAILSKARWLEEGEKPSCLFFKLECEYIQHISIFSVLDSNDVEVNSHVRGFYRFRNYTMPLRPLISPNRRVLTVFWLTVLCVISVGNALSLVKWLIIVQTHQERGRLSIRVQIVWVFLLLLLTQPRLRYVQKWQNFANSNLEANANEKTRWPPWKEGENGKLVKIVHNLEANANEQTRGPPWKAGENSKISPTTTCRPMEMRRQEGPLGKPANLAKRAKMANW